MARIECKGLSIRLASGDSHTAPFHMRGLDLAVKDGEVMVVLGPSGCGKSTLLRLIAGLMAPDSGSVLYDGIDMDYVKPGERKIGMVFQDYALFPNFTARANVLSYFLFRKKTPELDKEAAEKYRRTAELLGVDIELLMDRMPRGLSGGEKQRVAIGRCITRDPRLFLLDEPFSNLDQKLRETYRVQLRQLLKQFGITTIYVTHDQVEALILADRIALMNVGGIEQVGTAQEIYNGPRSAFAAGFINFEPEAPAINLIEGELLDPSLEGRRVGIRPDQVLLGEAGSRAALRAPAEILDLMPMPLRDKTIACFSVAGSKLYGSFRDASGMAIGSRIELFFPRYHLFDELSGLRVGGEGY